MQKLADIRMRDPFVLPVPEEKTYYLYGSTDPNTWDGPGTGFEAYRSPNLEDWEGPFPVFRPSQGFWADRHFWAPEVHRWAGRFFMFASFKAADRPRATQIFVADSPLGPFLPHGAGPVTPPGWECLDGTLWVEEGRPWLVFCREWLQVGDGEIHALPLAADLSAAAGEPRRLFRASEAPWSQGFVHEGRTSRVTDGPFVVREGAALKLLWSSKGDQGYALGTAVSPSGALLGPWVQQPRPDFAQDGGHGMVFTTFEGKRLLSLHHPNQLPLERPRFLTWA